MHSEMRLRIALLAALALGASAAEPLRFAHLDGESVELALAEEDRALLVHFWATWCPSCVEELAHLDRAAASCRERGVTVVAVNVGEEAEVVRRYWTEHGLGLEALRDPKGRIWRRVSGIGLPANLVWTGAGRRTDVGPRDMAGWEEELAALGCAAPAP